MDVCLGFDVGGTHCRAAVVRADGEVIDSASAPTPQSEEALEGLIVEMVDGFRGHAPHAVGLAVAGFLDPGRETVRFAPHLPWRDARVGERIAARTGLPVTLEHDANSAAWGEYRFGAARDADIWVFFAVGTGIGATLMIDGEIFRGAHGTAPEFGHLTVVPGGRPCPCGKRGCLERYASGTALEEDARALGWTGAEVTAAARRGDGDAAGIVEKFSGWLGEGLSMVVDVLDPGLILLGGGVSAEADLFLGTARETMARRIVGAGHRPLPAVEVAALGPRAAMIGVADLARAEARP